MHPEMADVRDNKVSETSISAWPSGRLYLEGQADLVSRLKMAIIRVTIWLIGVINLLTKSP